METCVLIPQELSLAVTAAGARSSGEQMVSVWSSTRIKQGELYYPFQGTVRIDKLNIHSYIDNDDVSTPTKKGNKAFFHVVSKDFQSVFFIAQKSFYLSPYVLLYNLIKSNQITTNIFFFVANSVSLEIQWKNFHTPYK